MFREVLFALLSVNQLVCEQVRNNLGNINVLRIEVNDELF